MVCCIDTVLKTFHVARWDWGLGCSTSDLASIEKLYILTCNIFYCQCAFQLLRQCSLVIAWSSKAGAESVMQ